jgi:hypothetical protein
MCIGGEGVGVGAGSEVVGRLSEGGRRGCRTWCLLVHACVKSVESAFWHRAKKLGGAGVLQSPQRWALLRADWILEISCCEAKPHHACEA